MAQIIRHRRGSLEALSAATSSFQKGELIIVSGSSNITATNGSGMVFAAVESGSIQAVNRFMIGDNAPNTFASSTYNGLVKGVPYYASGSSTLYLLGSDGNDIPDLTGNISNFSSSVAVSLNSLSQSIGSGTIGNSVSLLNTFSGSTLDRLTNLESTSASVNTSVEALNTSSASQQASIDALNSYTSSNTSTTALNSFTASADGRLTNLESTSASVNTSITNINSFSASTIASLGELQTKSASVDVSISNINTFSGSTLGRLTNLESKSASVDISVTELNSYSSSLKQAFTASGADVTFSGNVTIPGNFTVAGTQTIVDSTTVQIGDNIIELNGSAAANGGLYIKDATAPNTATGSLLWDTTNDYWKAGVKDSEIKILLADGDSVVSGSSQITISSTTGFDTYSGSVSASFAEVIANVGSGVGVSITNLNSFTSSTLGRLTNIESTSASVDGRLTNIETTSASVNTSVAALNTSSASQQTQLDTLTSKTGSYATTGSNAFIGNQEITGSINVKDSATTFSIVGNGFSETYLQSNGGMLLQAGAGGVQIKSNSLAVDSNLTVGGDISGSIVGIGNVTAFSTSVDSRFDNLESKSASVDTSIAALNSFTSSNTSTTALNAFTGSAEGRLTNLETTSASVNNSVTALNTSTASQQISIDALNVTSASLNTFSGSTLDRLTNIETTSASVNNSITALNSSTASQQTSIDALNSYTSSNTSTTALNAFTASADGRLTNLELTSASVNTSITNINSFSASTIISLGELQTKSASVDISISNINSFSSSTLGRLTNIETTSASVNTSISNINTFSGSTLERLTNIETTSASVNISVSNLNTTTASLNTSVAALNTYSSSLKQAFEFTGSNVVVLGDFTVKGTTTSVESNTIQLGDNIIELNGTGAANGGLLVKDPTAPNTVSGSLLWDSTNDYWKAGAAGAESKLLRADGDNVVTESAQILLTQVNGYETFSGSVATSFSASNASITSLSASVASVTGDFSSSVATSFSASAASQTTLSSSFTTSQGVQDGRLDLLEASTGSLNLFTSSIDTTIKTKLDAETVVSGSSQIDITATTGFSTFSASIETRISLIDGGTY